MKAGNCHLKKIRIGVILLSCLVLVGLIFVIKNSSSNLANAKVSTPTSDITNNENTNQRLQEMNDLGFLLKVGGALKREGYIAGVIVSSVYEDRNELLIPISSEKYKGEQTEKEIQKIVEKISNECKIKSKVTINLQKADL